MRINILFVLDVKKNAVLVLFDLSAAFDVTNHGISLSKLFANNNFVDKTLN